MQFILGEHDERFGPRKGLCTIESSSQLLVGVLSAGHWRRGRTHPFGVKTSCAAEERIMTCERPGAWASQKISRFPEFFLGHSNFEHFYKRTVISFTWTTQCMFNGDPYRSCRVVLWTPFGFFPNLLFPRASAKGSS